MFPGMFARGIPGVPTLGVLGEAPVWGGPVLMRWPKPVDGAPVLGPMLVLKLGAVGCPTGGALRNVPD